METTGRVSDFGKILWPSAALSDFTYEPVEPGKTVVLPTGDPSIVANVAIVQPVAEGATRPTTPTEERPPEVMPGLYTTAENTGVIVAVVETLPFLGSFSDAFTRDIVVFEVVSGPGDNLFSVGNRILMEDSLLEFLRSNRLCEIRKLHGTQPCVGSSPREGLECQGLESHYALSKGGVAGPPIARHVLMLDKHHVDTTRPQLRANVSLHLPAEPPRRANRCKWVSQGIGHLPRRAHTI